MSGILEFIGLIPQIFKIAKHLIAYLRGKTMGQKRAHLNELGAIFSGLSKADSAKMSKEELEKIRWDKASEISKWISRM